MLIDSKTYIETERHKLSDIAIKESKARGSVQPASKAHWDTPAIKAAQGGLEERERSIDHWSRQESLELDPS